MTIVKIPGCQWPWSNFLTIDQGEMLQGVKVMVSALQLLPLILRLRLMMTKIDELYLRKISNFGQFINIDTRVNFIVKWFMHCHIKLVKSTSLSI